MAALLALAVCLLPSLAPAQGLIPGVGPGEAAITAVQGIPGVTVDPVLPDERMLVEAEQLVYDYDNETVSAVGNVIIYYGGYTLEADKVSYDQRNGRLIATGHVRMTDPSGAIFTSEHFDVTDDFADAFVRSLSVETTQRTRFSAESAERTEEATIFTNGSYTACVSCIDTPDKPPFWKIKAKKIVIDHEEQEVAFSDASFEFFGKPIAWFPYFSIADPSVKRKSGFLAPHFGYSGRLGASVATPYYFALAPNYDFTLTPSVYTRQGPMLEGEFRHRTLNGAYTINAAGIYQFNKDAFDPDSASYQDWRGGIRTVGNFDINRDWTFGWDGTLSSDRTFTRDYLVLNQDTSETVSTMHLTGLRDQSYFELRGSHYRILSDPDPWDPKFEQERQAIPVPVLDYERIFDSPYLGGEVRLTSNVATLFRHEDDPFMADAMTYYHGTEGKNLRATQEIAWQSRHIGPMGQVFKPFAYVSGDLFFMDNSDSSATTMAGLTNDSFAYRVMPAVGLDWSLPVLISDGGSTHIIEPRAQIIARPDEMRAGELPNNDAQSLVFDETNLFDHDKFSGFDRNEGGVRLNLGLHYNASFDHGGSLSSTVGQSFHLAGTNPYANPDIANVGPATGLESSASDYVAGVAYDTGLGHRFSARGRFDEHDLGVKRAEVGASSVVGALTASASYVYLSPNVNSGIDSSSSVIRGAASVTFLDNWRAFGALTYDLNESQIASDSFGIAYDDESATVALAFSETRENYTDLTANRWISLRIQLRTLGDTDLTTDLNRLSN